MSASVDNENDDLEAMSLASVHAMEIASHLTIKGHYLLYLPQDTKRTCGVSVEDGCQLFNDCLINRLDMLREDLMFQEINLNATIVNWGIPKCGFSGLLSVAVGPFDGFDEGEIPCLLHMLTEYLGQCDSEVRHRQGVGWHVPCDNCLLKNCY